jgi:hypothetical protein
MHDFGPYGRRNWVDPGGQYITHYYAGQIPADAVRILLPFYFAL